MKKGLQYMLTVSGIILVGGWYYQVNKFINNPQIEKKSSNITSESQPQNLSQQGQRESLKDTPKGCQGLELSSRCNVSKDVRPMIILGPSDMYQDEKDFDHFLKVPHIIHQTSKEKTLSVVFLKWMRSWLTINPRWQYWFWDDDDIEKLISTRYHKFKNIFHEYSYSIQRSDVFRYFVLYEFGGFYADCDVECLKPLDEVVDSRNCVLSTEPDIHALTIFDKKLLISNAIMACRPRHPFFENVINNLTKVDRHKNDIMTTTGPLMLDSAHTNFSLQSTDSPYVADPEMFQPISDSRIGKNIEEKCRKMVAEKRDVQRMTQVLKTCGPFLEGVPETLSNRSLTVHHWAHTWLLKSVVDIFGLRESKKTFHVADLNKTSLK